MISLAQLERDLADRKVDAQACAAVVKRATSAAAITAKVLESATAKHAQSCDAFARAEVAAVAKESEKTLRAYVDSDATRTLTGKRLDVAKQDHAKAEAALADAQNRLDAAQSAILVGVKAIAAHPSTVHAETVEPSRKALDAIVSIMAACTDLDAAIRKSRVAVVGSDHEWSPRAAAGSHIVVNLLALIEAEHARVPNEIVMAALCAWGEPKRERGEREPHVKATQLVALIGDVLAGPVASDAKRAEFRAELARVRANVSTADAAAAKQKENEAIDKARIEKGHAAAERFRADKARRIANGTWKPAPPPSNLVSPSFLGPDIGTAPHNLTPQPHAGIVPMLPANVDQSQRMAASAHRVDDIIDAWIGVPDLGPTHISRELGPLTGDPFATR